MKRVVSPLVVTAAVLLTAQFFALSCSDEDAVPVDGGLGGLISSSGGSAGGSGSPNAGGEGGDTAESDPPDEPLYGEGGVAPEELRLTFQEISIPDISTATDFAFLPPGDDLSNLSVLVLSRNNEIHLVGLENGEADVRRSWDFADDAFVQYACAPTNVLLDRDFSQNHFIYITKCAEVDTTQLLRFTFDEEEGLSDRQVIFETTLPGTTNGWHRMGSMGWESDHVLWLLVGDHSDEEGNENAQDLSNPLGALVRIVPKRESGRGGHGIPPGNFASQRNAPANVHPAIYAYGLRSPWRGTRDSLGRYWVGDVGEYGFEEVNLVVDPGENFGWNAHEGFCEDNCEGLIDPVVAYDRDSQQPYVLEEPMAGGSSQRAVWVGEIYDSPHVDRYEGLMDGVVPFGDLFVGFVRGLRAGGRPQANYDAPIGLLGDVTSWKVGPDGYAYAADLRGNLHVALLDYE